MGGAGQLSLPFSTVLETRPHPQRPVLALPCTSKAGTDRKARAC